MQQMQQLLHAGAATCRWLLHVAATGMQQMQQPLQLLHAGAADMQWLLQQDTDTDTDTDKNTDTDTTESHMQVVCVAFILILVIVTRRHSSPECLKYEDIDTHTYVNIYSVAYALEHLCSTSYAIA
jgi:hypothetical protein